MSDVLQKATMVSWAIGVYVILEDRTKKDLLA